MTVRELIEELQYAPEDAQVRIATQPSWPFEYSISTAALAEPGAGYEIIRADLHGEGDAAWWVANTEGEHDDDYGPFETEPKAHAALAERLQRDGETEPVFYIGEGTQLGYLPSGARAAIGWSR